MRSWSDVHDVHDCLITGLTELCLHLLCMLEKPFNVQLVVPSEMLWTVVNDNRTTLNAALMKCEYASWYQLFPLTPSECKHRVLRSCFTNFSSPLFPPSSAYDTTALWEDDGHAVGRTL